MNLKGKSPEDIPVKERMGGGYVPLINAKKNLAHYNHA